MRGKPCETGMSYADNPPSGSRKLPILTSLAAVVLCLLTACGPDRADDQRARSFIALLQAGDSIALDLLEPGSELQNAGWNALVRMRADRFPGSPVDTVVLTDWEWIHDQHGPARKLTYQIRSSDEYSIVQLWLVSVGDQTYVNTIQSTGPLPVRSEK